MSSIGLAFSIVSVLCSGSVFYKFFELQRELSTTRETVKQAVTALNSASTNPASQPSASTSSAAPPANPEAANQVPDESTNPAAPPANSEATNSTESQTTPETTQSASAPTEVKPGEYIQSAFGDAVKVELLQVNRIQHRETGRTDFVNVRFRVRRVTDIPLESASIYATRVWGRHPTKGEGYEAPDFFTQKYMGQIPISVLEIPKGASVDAYVWLEVPEEVKAIDILIPNTEEFANVPIRDLSTPR